MHLSFLAEKKLQVGDIILLEKVMHVFSVRIKRGDITNHTNARDLRAPE
jgi:hypothetical protein